MTHESSPSVPKLTRRGKQARAAALLGSALASGYGVHSVATSGPEYPSCIQTHAVAVPEGGSLWAVAESSVPNVDPRETIDAIKHFSDLTTNTVREGQMLSVPTPSTIHCEQ